MVPLPPSVWTQLDGRRFVLAGYEVLNVDAPWLPISLAPYRSFNALLAILPPLALFCAIVRLRAYRASWLAGALLTGTIAGILLGSLQVSSPDNASSAWYLYNQSTFGVASGFFANGNHMATLLVATIPFLAAIWASARGTNRQRHTVIVALVGGMALLIFVGIVLNRSLAAYGLTPPVLVASALILLKQGSKWRRWTALLSGLLLFGAVAVLVTSSVRSLGFPSDASTAVQSRQEMLGTSAKAIGDFMPWGSGLGSFRSIYQLYEDPALVGDTYVIHAHNDYVEFALETGVAGILLMVAFLGWFVRAGWRAWRRPDASAYARAATIASAAILVHSVVDFPLRTAAISALFAVCLALLGERRALPVSSRSDLRPARHIVVT